MSGVGEVHTCGCVGKCVRVDVGMQTHMVGTKYVSVCARVCACLCACVRVCACACVCVGSKVQAMLWVQVKVRMHGVCMWLDAYVACIAGLGYWSARLTFSLQSR